MASLLRDRAASNEVSIPYAGRACNQTEAAVRANDYSPHEHQVKDDKGEILWHDIGNEPNQAGGLPHGYYTTGSPSRQVALMDRADELGQELGFIRRKRKLSGSTFLRTLVFGFQAEPHAGYGNLSQSAASIGVGISTQGLEQRFTETAARLVYQVLMCAVEQVIASHPAAIPILQRFEGVYLRDSSVIGLPVELAAIWPGVGDSRGPTAALKLQVEFNFSTGQLGGPILQSGRTHDQSSPFEQRRLPGGALRLEDLGYFRLERLAADDQQGVYWIMRLKGGTAVYTVDGQRLDLVRWLNAQEGTLLDQRVWVGARQRLACRLLAVRVPPEAAEQRRRRLREYARKKQVSLKAETVELAEWTLLITNAPEEKLSLPEALILQRVRWQIELLFKLWKSHAQVDEWHSHNPWRILCEIYAKLIGVLILHWVCLTSLWERPNRSLFKAAHTVQSYAVVLALALTKRKTLISVLRHLRTCLIATCQVNRRKKHPSTWQLLLDVP